MPDGVPIKRWFGRGEMVYAFHNVPLDSGRCKLASAIVTDLVACGATSVEAAAVVAKTQEHTLAVLESLHAHMLIGKSYIHSEPRWYITPSGLTSLDFGHAYTASQDVCRPRDDLGALPLNDLTNFEIIQELQALGWKWEQLPVPKKRPTNFVHVVGGVRTWFGGVDRQRLLTFLRISRLNTEALRSWSVCEVQHLGSAKYYKAVNQAIDCQGVCC